MANKKKDGRVNNGGHRDNAGRKKELPYETKNKRIPVPLEPAVDKLIAEFKLKNKKA